MSCLLLFQIVNLIIQREIFAALNLDFVTSVSGNPKSDGAIVCIVSAGHDDFD